MTHPQINFKSRFLAGLLGYLVPGTGHLYQGRTFKGIVYFVCIFGMFLCGMSLSNWRCVSWSSEPGKKTYGYFAQLGVGLPSLPAYIQSRRFYNRNNNDLKQIDGNIATTFHGEFSSMTDLSNSESVEVTGELEIKRMSGTFEGVFRGNKRNANGSTEPVELKLGHDLALEKPLKATKDRAFSSLVVNDKGEPVAEIKGFIPRSLFDRFEMPLDDDVLQKMHNTGRPWELALVMTWIAGLLNILAVWDAVEGPAYGYDDEELKEEEQKKTKEKKAKKKSDSASENLSNEEDVTTSTAEKSASKPASISTPESPTLEVKKEN